MPGVFVLAPGTGELVHALSFSGLWGGKGGKPGSGEMLASRVLRRETAVNTGFAGAGPADELSPP